MEFTNTLYSRGKGQSTVILKEVAMRGRFSYNKRYHEKKDGQIMIESIQVGPITFHMYGIMVAIGYISAFLVSEKRAKKRGMDADLLYGIFWCAVFGGALGSKLLYYIVNIENIIKDPSMILRFKEGWVVYGGILGGVLASFFYCKWKKADFVAYLDLVLPAVALAQGFGRIGCFFSGCCYGRETDSVFGITYWQSNFAPNGVKLIPTQIYSSIGDFAIAFLLMAYAKRKPAKGKVAAGYCILYSIGRFVIEMFRNDYRGEFGPLSTSQLISVFILVLGIGMYVWAGKSQSESE